jgi:hypothetical protein
VSDDLTRERLIEAGRKAFRDASTDAIMRGSKNPMGAAVDAVLLLLAEDAERLGAVYDITRSRNRIHWPFYANRLRSLIQAGGETP